MTNLWCIIVNELSNTIDLPSTLLRAQSLFRRFQRTVDAVDKKHNFPSPPIRQRKPTDSSAAGNSTQQSPPAATGTDIRNGVARKAKAKAKEGTEGDIPKEKVISPELRGLLSRKVIVLEKDGGGETVPGMSKS